MNTVKSLGKFDVIDENGTQHTIRVSQRMHRVDRRFGVGDYADGLKEMETLDGKVVKWSKGGDELVIFDGPEILIARQVVPPSDGSPIRIP